MDSDEKDLKPFARLGELARSLETGKISRSVDALGEYRVAEAFEKSRKRPARRIAGIGVVVAMMAAVLVVSSARLSKPALSWTVDGSASLDTKYVSPTLDKEASVRFSEGSEFKVQPGGRLRIAEAGRKTVKAVLETGVARVRISTRSTIGWKIDAGPFSVSPGAVASLMVEWLADELLRVSIFEGETSIEGTPSPLFLRAGQRVSANSRDGTIEVGPLANAPVVPSAPSAEIASEPPDHQAPPPRQPTTVPNPALPAPPANKRPTWSEAVAGGDYVGVLLDAERRGVSSVLAEGSMADVIALADAARLMGRNDLARRTLLAERSRFPRASTAADAAFFLGRMADDQEHAPATALPWYETYLSEAPGGHFAAEAFGRKMVAISKQSGRSAARETAAQYLRRFPAGPHAAVARELLGN